MTFYRAHFMHFLIDFFNIYFAYSYRLDLTKIKKNLKNYIYIYIKIIQIKK
jgi:hypothetical protein